MSQNTLTETQKRCLQLVQEECAELIQACSKMIRFGIDGRSDTNLKQEYNDLIVVSQMAFDSGVCALTGDVMCVDKKIDKLKENEAELMEKIYAGK